ncbi:AbrB/MazE/SpoVT family DNA-binding domain-containing protein [Candidatus Bathyarchaeota archaeon]|nr:AbrB/MazE/SpoVT family DNA-binding domain-containing protein [Candidatus Bathyarchaeota archaeon]
MERVRLSVKLGSKGQLVIPKVIRESLGLIENKHVILEVKDKSIEIRALDKDIVEKWREVAEREALDVSRELVYGDKLYHDV